MVKRQGKEEQNPLLARNIPPPPAAAPEIAAVSARKTVSEENGIRGERQAVIPASTEASARREEERATIELSLYLRPAQDDKLEDLRRSYKKRTGKKISANEVMRRLIDQATVDTLIG